MHEEREVEAHAPGIGCARERLRSHPARGAPRPGDPRRIGPAKKATARHYLLDEMQRTSITGCDTTSELYRFDTDRRCVQNQPVSRRIRIFLRGMCLGMDPTLAFGGVARIVAPDEQGTRDDWSAVGRDLTAAFGRWRVHRTRTTVPGEPRVAH